MKYASQYFIYKGENTHYVKYLADFSEQALLRMVGGSKVLSKIESKIEHKCGTQVTHSWETDG